MNQTGLMLSALQTHLLPSLARMSVSERQEHLSRILILSSTISGCLILGLTALKLFVLHTLYSDQFDHAARYLRWTLVGDFFKITSWVLSSTFLASARSGLFLVADFASYGTFGLTAWLLSASTQPAEAAAIGFLAMYIVHSTICAGVLWSKAEYRPSPAVGRVWLGALALVVAGSVAFWEQR
jgi:O-antigen/teichoic acid export membrane protein